MVTLSLAWRNLWRAPQRTALTASAIAVGLAMFLLMLAWVQGFVDFALESTTRAWSGMAQVHSTGWVETEEATDVIPGGTQVLTQARALPHTVSATPRAYGEAIATMGDRTAAVRLVGVDFVFEKSTTNFSENLSAGAWPSEPNHILIGVKLAEELELGVGDKVALTAADVRSGELNGALVRIAGLLFTSNAFLDRHAVLGQLEAMQELLGLDDDFHEIVMQLEVPIADKAAINMAIAPLAGDGRVVRPWQLVQRDLASSLELQKKILWLAVLTVFLIAAFGIVNTMTMSFLERFHEFGILLAIGTSPARIFSLIAFEAAWLGLVGVLGGLAIGSVFYIPLSTIGLTLGGAEAYGVNFDRNIMFRIDVAQSLWLVLVFLILTVVTGMVTARRAARTSPVEALRQG